MLCMQTRESSTEIADPRFMYLNVTCHMTLNNQRACCSLLDILLFRELKTLILSLLTGTKYITQCDCTSLIISKKKEDSTKPRCSVLDLDPAKLIRGLKLRSSYCCQNVYTRITVTSQGPCSRSNYTSMPVSRLTDNWKPVNYT